jgi:hypothetical protein
LAQRRHQLGADLAKRSRHKDGPCPAWCGCHFPLSTLTFATAGSVERVDSLALMKVNRLAC